MHSKEWCKCIGCHGIACSSLFFLYYICEITLKIFAFFNLLSIFFSLTNGKSWLLRSVFRENRASKTKRNTQEDHIFFFCSVAVDCAQESNKLSIKQYLKVLNAVLLFLRRLLFPFRIEMGRCDLCVTSMRSVSQLLAPNEPAVRLSGMEVLLMLTLRRHRRIVAVLCLVFIVFCCIPLWNPPFLFLCLFRVNAMKRRQ